MQAKRTIVWPALVGAAIAANLAGCSNQSFNPGATAVSASAKTVTQTLITDAPADQILSLSLTIDSIVLTDATGAATTILSTPVKIEASHLDAVQEPLLPPLSIPQDTYTSASFTVASPVVAYIDSTTGKPVTADATLANATDTVTFTTPIVVSATAAPICFDLLVGQSVTISGSTVSVSPMFNVTQIPLAPQPTNGSNGMVSGALGQIVSVSGTALVVALPNGQQLTIATNSSTTLQGFGALSSLTAGELVNVDYAQQTGGTLLALRIQLVPAPVATVFGGPVTAVTGSPATSFTQLVRQPLGAMAPPSTTGSSNTIDVTGSTLFQLPGQMATLPALPFTPAFSAATLFAGQNVLVAAASVSGSTVTAQSVTLLPQTIDGTIASISTTSTGTVYTVTLPSQSALGTLTGKTTVTVYAGPSTQMLNSPTASGPARFNGLLFSNNGTLSLVAGASNGPPPAAPPQHP